MRDLDRAGLDRWITGNYGEDQFSKYDREEEREEPMERLKTETNTPEMEERIKKAFQDSPLYTHGCDAAFEHGQWWVTCWNCGAAWSVVDAEPGIDGFDFEEVSHGDECHMGEET